MSVLYYLDDWGQSLGRLPYFVKRQIENYAISECLISPYLPLACIWESIKYVVTADHHSNHSPELKFNDRKTTSLPLQFFVRMMWKCNTIVIHASREDTVESILEQISSKTKIPIEHQRLIYNGKQLQQ
jgi:hypothetical protein